LNNRWLPRDKAYLSVKIVKQEPNLQISPQTTLFSSSGSQPEILEDSSSFKEIKENFAVN
jgi:hypothetical protein